MYDRAFGAVIFYGGNMENKDTRVAVIGIIVENQNSVGELNRILSEYRDVIIGRMGIPYTKKNVNCITVVVDVAIAPEVVSGIVASSSSSL